MDLHNATYAEEVTSKTLQQTATGKSIIWALVAIVLNAMLQPSFTGYIWSHDTFEDSIWPHRCSPFICAIDCAAELWILIKGPHKGNTTAERPSFANSTTVTMRLAIFVLGVLPQAIKLFSMRGMLLVQIIAAVFMLASTVSMLRTLLVREAQKDVAALADTVRDFDVEKYNNFKDEFKYGIGLSLAPTYLGLLVHAAFLWHVWCYIADNIAFSVSADTTKIALIAREVFGSLFVLYWAQHVLSVLTLGRRVLPFLPWVFLLEGTSMQDVLYLTIDRSEGCASRCSKMRGWRFGVTLLSNAVMFSWVAAFCLQWIARKALSWSEKQFTSRNEEHSATESTTGGQQALQSGQDQPPGDLEAGNTFDDHSNSDEADDYTQGQDTHNAEAPPPYTSIEAGGLELAPLPPYTAGDEQTLSEAMRHGSGDANQNEDLSGTASHYNAGSTSLDDTAMSRHPDGNDQQTTLNYNNVPDESTSAEIPRWEEAWEPKTVCGHILMIVLVISGVCFIFPLLLLVSMAKRAGVIPRENNNAAVMEEGQATVTDPLQTESSEPGQNDATTMQRSSFFTREGLKAALTKVAHKVGQAMITGICIIFVRIYMALASMWWLPWKWLRHKIQRDQKDVLWIAFGLLNFITAVVYLLKIYNATGTYNPNWTSFLG